MQPVYITAVSFDPNSYLSSVPCGAGMLSCLTGLTVDHWIKRIVNYRKKNKRYKDEYTDFYTSKGEYWYDRYRLYFNEAMHFLKPYNPKKVIEFRNPPTLRNLMTKKCHKDKTYVIWFKDRWFGGHTAIIHQGAYWDNDTTKGVTVKDYNHWHDYKVAYMVEITPKMQDKMIPLEEGEIDITPSEWCCSQSIQSWELSNNPWMLAA